jgi:hypothetical protein
MGVVAMAKTCVVCGVDCSGKPRVKDPQGRYCCQPCFDTAEARKANVAAAPRVDDEPFRIDDPAFEEPLLVPVAEDEIIPLAPAAMNVSTPAACLRCGSSWVPQAQSCMVCGAKPGQKAGGDGAERVGKAGKAGKSGAKSRKPVPCGKCGYDLSGLRTFKCPECGHTNTPSMRPTSLAETSREVARQAYSKPLIYMAVGLAVTAMVGIGQGEIAGLVVQAVLFPVSVIIAYCTMWVLCALWVGLSSSALLMLVQIAAIHGIIMGVASVIDLFPVPRIFRLLLYGIIYVYLLTEWLDMDSTDARIAAALVYFVQVGVFILAFMLAADLV